MSESIGSRLRYAREAKGISIAELASKVRIREALIKHIEKDNLETVGADVYVKGHIRAMAKFLEIDANELMALYPVAESAKPFDEPAEMPVIQELQNLNLATKTDKGQFSGSFFNPIEKFKVRSGANWSVVMAGALGIITFIAIGSVVINIFNSPSAVQEVAASPQPSVTPTLIEPRVNSSENLTAAVTPPGVDVLLKAEGSSSWVRATDVNGVELFEGIIKKDQEQRVGSVEGVKLLLGNAGAISLTVNGQVLGKAGGNGEVVRVEFGPEGPVQ